MSSTACHCCYGESDLEQKISEYYKKKTLDIKKAVAVAVTDETPSDVSQKSYKTLLSLISYLFVDFSFEMLSDKPSVLNMLYVKVIYRLFIFLSAALNHSFHQH